jgi:hypothetical protein
MRTFDEEIARRLQEAADSGELQGAKSYGKPTPEDPGWDATPEALRMPMKILKDAGATPPEIAMFHERARLRVQITSSADPGERQRLQLRLVQLEAVIAIRLEALRINTGL